MTELLSKIKIKPSEQYESELIEFKNYNSENSLHNAKELAEEISALANKNGGQIIIGIIDSSNIKDEKWHKQLNGFTKVDLDTTKERLLGKINPKINLKLSEIEFESKNYLIIEIPNVNHTIVTTSSGKTYIREGKSSVPASPEQIKNLVKNLQSYDWSGEENNLDIVEVLNKKAISEAKQDFCDRRESEIEISELTDLKFLEAIGATKNGILNNSGLLFFGTREAINKYLGLFEYRFSWKTQDGLLKTNDVWDDCIWKSIKKVKSHFFDCNRKITLPYEGNDYELNTLDEQAFHEAFLNSIVHRDYTVDGMTSVNFKENELVITNPGTFYGGVNSENISFHEPRHRNKTLARALMAFQLVDRAGMGVLRIGLNSLIYGRDLPVWRENLDNIEIKMPVEYFKAEIFILTQKYIPKCSITDLYIINNLFKVGFINISVLERDLSKIVQNPWLAIEKSMEREEMQQFFLYHGNNDGIYICTNARGIIALGVGKAFKTASNSEKHVKLFRYLKRHKTATNEEIMTHLSFSYSSSTSTFLKKLKYIKNSGQSRSSRWSLK
jgi:ATP-dependent DNA helicase RecG